MNPFFFTIVSLCMAGTFASASQYGAPASYNSGYNQRKMAPSPQQYGAQQASYGGYGNEMSSYGGEQQSYNHQAPMAQSYGKQQSYAPSSAQVSSYDERAPAASSYGRTQQSYAKPQQQAYAAPASSYGKQAAKYEEQYHAPMPFAWGYDINDGYGGAQYHKETGDEYGKRTGSYGYTDAYGIYRQVDYVADEHGFRATIKTNEPGTANESPADVELHAYEPPSNYYAGNSGYGNNAGYQQQSSGYGKQASSKSYSAPASSYSAPAAPVSSYSAPVQQSYSAPAPSYGHQQRSYGKQQSSYQAARPMYQEQQSYSSSAMVPVYSKANAAAAVPVAKKY